MYIDDDNAYTVTKIIKNGKESFTNIVYVMVEARSIWNSGLHMAFKVTNHREGIGNIQIGSKIDRSCNQLLNMGCDYKFDTSEFDVYQAKCRRSEERRVGKECRL